MVSVKGIVSVLRITCIIRIEVAIIYKQIEYTKRYPESGNSENYFKDHHEIIANRFVAITKCQ